VSNFSIAQLKELLPYAKDIPISCNQVEVHPWLPQNKLIAFCKEHDILVSCYSPFAGQKKSGAQLVEDEKVKALAEKNGLGVGQLLQSWAVQRGTVPLGKSSNKERIKANLSVVRLSDEDFESINALALPGDEGRTINFSEAWGFTLFKD
jgi:diketogulonate reductase-like aldo/keto reductase